MRRKGKICRLCLTKNVELVGVFESNRMPGWTLAEAITELLQIRVTKGDIYPQSVCIECTTRLEEFKLFKRQCERNKDLLDSEYYGNRRNASFEDFVGQDHREQRRIERDLEEEDVFGLDETDNPIKTEIEGNCDESNVINPSAVVESADWVSIPKCEYVDQVRTVKTNEINVADNTTTDVAASMDDIPDLSGQCESNYDQPEGGIKEDLLDIPAEIDSDGSFDEAASYLGNELEQSDGCIKEEAVESNPDRSSKEGLTLSFNLSSVECSDLEKDNELGGISSNAGFSGVGVKRLTLTEDSNTRLKPFNCELCGRGFILNRSLKNHNCSKDGGDDSNVKSVQERLLSDKEPSGVSNTGRRKLVRRSKKTFESPKSDKAFCNKGNLKTNITSRGVNRRFKCTVCDKSYCRVRDLNKHLVSHSIDKPIKSTQTLTQKDEIGEQSLAIHSVERPYRCGECSETFDRKSDLKTHMDTHSATKPFETFYSKVNLETYMTSNAGIKPHECKKCGKTFSFKGNLKSHVKSHLGIKIYECNLCSKTFSTNSNLKTHILSHTGFKPHKCDLCGKRFTTKSHLKTHKMVHLGTGQYKCDACLKSFTSKVVLKRHLTTHSGIKPYKCMLCGKAFSSKGQLVKHTSLHSGQRSYKCNECSKTFNQKCHLKTHMMTHFCEKPFKCGDCDKAFSTKSYLNTHRITHTGVRPHKCNICAKSFFEKGTLNTHVKTHSGIKPHKCTECDKSYTLKSTLNRHMAIHSGIKPFKCHECARTFSMKSILKTHMSTHTGFKP